MKKRVLTLLTALALMLALLPGTALAASTRSGTCGADGDNIKWSLSGGVLTLSGSGAMRHFEANKYGDPDEVVPWLDQMTKINKVVIGNGITTIGNYAFWGFTSLSSVTIADSVQSIGCAAFYNCTALTSVKLPASLTRIDMSAFADCTGLKRVDIPAGVTEVGIAAFIEGNSKLEVHFQGNAPASLGGTGSYTLDPSWGPSFDSGATLYYRSGTSGWTDSEYYDAAARTWKGYALRADPPFPDVAADAWYAEAVEFAVANGLMKGKDGNQFKPLDNITRAEVVTILARRDGVDTDGGANWYEKAMAWSVDAGVSDGTNPTVTITREQLAVMLYRLEDKPDVNLTILDSYPDVSSVHTWTDFPEAMAWAVEQGIITGTGDGRLNPQGTATRAEVATMVQRYCEKLG